MKSVEIGSDGLPRASLNDGTPGLPPYPTSLQDDEFTRLLNEKNVEVKAVGPRTSLASVLLSLLPLIVFIAIFVYLGRSARRQLAGMGGIGRSRAKVFDAERPETTFGDIAGYEGAKREVTEVVALKHRPLLPGRGCRAQGCAYGRAAVRQDVAGAGGGR